MTTNPEPAASPVGSVDKALVLLEILASAGPEGMTLRDIAAAGDFNKASVHRLLRALMHRGFADQSPGDQHYRLGTAVLELGHSFGGGENLPVLFAPALAAISHSSQELVHLGRLDGPHVLYLDKVEPERTLRVWSSIGKRAPAARTAMGRALLAADGVRGPALEAYARATESSAAQPGAVITLDELADVVEGTAERGWSMEIEENEAGIACVGVALARPGGRSVSVSVTGPIERMDERRRAEIGALLREELSHLAPAGFEVAATA
ncbi:IclR family transcriptional regulator [Brachybacterium fresconis]|uniref:DNA-binding IclR family transcriptional regulator n=1 Tax=Brachybacterium fresconis TaxID=173363 RepID=A0ABS4YLU6_9MICO|nr:IclR family transcriptional regulator [Brachybacterium fresconis]MBP2409773.1 DNA-binding IclR family transcriptional regulator [Brachybacterium fresconis]